MYKELNLAQHIYIRLKGNCSN